MPSLDAGAGRVRSRRAAWRLFLVVVGITAVVTAPLVVFGDALDARFADGKGVAMLREHGGWASLVAIALIVSDIVLPVPTPAVMAALGMLYGPWTGGLISSAGSILAGLVAYWSCRLAGKRAARFLLGPDNLSRLSRFFGRIGLAAIALSRWMPVLPEALACLAGMSRMPAPRFTFALTVGGLAMGFTFAALGTAYAERPVLGLVLSALVPLAAWPALAYWMRRRDRALRALQPMRHES